MKLVSSRKKVHKELTLKALGDAVFRQNAFDTLALATSSATIIPDADAIKLIDKLRKFAYFCVDY